MVPIRTIAISATPSAMPRSLTAMLLIVPNLSASMRLVSVPKADRVPGRVLGHGPCAAAQGDRRLGLGPYRQVDAGDVARLRRRRVEHDAGGVVIGEQQPTLSRCGGIGLVRPAHRLERAAMARGQVGAEAVEEAQVPTPVCLL